MPVKMIIFFVAAIAFCGLCSVIWAGQMPSSKPRPLVSVTGESAAAVSSLSSEVMTSSSEFSVAAGAI